MNTLNYEQDVAEKLGELGSRLRQRREEKSMTIEQVAAKTMIQPRLLSAIEEGRLDRLPEPIYTQGLIRRFAESLDLNGDEFASAFPARPRALSAKPAWRQLPATQLRPIHLYLLYVVLIVVAVSGLSSFINRSTVKVGGTPAPLQPQSPLKAPAATPVRATSRAPGPAKKPAAARTIPAAGKPVQVEVIAKQESWLEIVADGKSVFQGTLPSGTQRAWAANQKLVVRAGNAGGVLAGLKGATAKPIGKLGTVDNVSFEAAGPNAAPQPASQSVGNPPGQ